MFSKVSKRKCGVIQAPGAEPKSPIIDGTFLPASAMGAPFPRGKRSPLQAAEHFRPCGRRLGRSLPLEGDSGHRESRGGLSCFGPLYPLMGTGAVSRLAITRSIMP